MFKKVILLFLFVFPTIVFGQVWTALDSFPGPGRYGVTAFAIGGVGYVGATGGSGSILYNDLYAYDPNSNQWTTKASLPSVGRRTGVGFSIGSFGFAGLGWSGSFDYTDFYKYNPSSNSWTSVASYPGGAGRVNYSAATSTKGYVGGGNYSTSNSTFQSDWWEYDPVSNSWDSLPGLPFGARGGGVAFAIGCQVFAGLGHNGITADNQFWSYNSQLREWEQVSNFPGLARLHPSSFIINGRAIVGGGYQRGTGIEFDDYYSYDPITDNWTTLPGFSSGKRGISEGFEIDGIGYVSAGWDSLNVSLNDLWSYVDTSNCETRLFDQLSSCGPFYSPIYSKQFDSSGIYYDTSGTGSCLTITTICVEILNVYDDTLFIVTCDSFVSSIGTFYNSGFYRDTLLSSLGCDSIVTLDLTVNNSFLDSIYIVKCGFYNGPSGKTYKFSGLYFDSLISSAGCDSVYFLDLTLFPSGLIDTILSFSCKSFIGPSGKVYTQSGRYFDTIYSSSGCDSIYYLDLTVNVINRNVSKNGNILFAVAPQASYQWVDCDSNFAIIPGETNQSMLLTRNGNFAAIIFKNGCIDTTDCYSVTGVGLTELSSNKLIKIYPNPAFDIVNIANNEQKILVYEIVDLDGKQIQTGKFEKQICISNLKKGAYVLILLGEEHSFKFKLFKN